MAASSPSPTPSTPSAQASVPSPSPASPAQSALALLRVQVVAARNLTPMDRNGLADPFVTVAFVGGALPTLAVQNNAKPDSTSAASVSTSSSSSAAAASTTAAAASASASAAAAAEAAAFNAGSQRRSTSVVNKTLNPSWPPNEATFDLPILPEWLADDPDPDAATAVTASTRQRKRSARIAGKAASAAFAPIRLTARGAAAGARAVRSRTPRPIIMGPNRRRRQRAEKQAAAATASASAGGAVSGQLELVPSRGSIVLARSPAASLKAGIVSGIELVVWDKDKYTRNDYMGEVSVPVEAWAPALAARKLLGDAAHVQTDAVTQARPGSDSIAWADAQPFWVPLRSTRLNSKKKVSGEIQIKVGLVPVPDATVEREPEPVEVGTQQGSTTEAELPTLADVYQALLLARLDSDNASVRAVPADQSVGTAPASEPFLDDGLSSDEEEDDLIEELETEDEEDDDEDEDDEDEEDGSDSEESYYETETDLDSELTDAENDFYRILGVAPPPGKEAGVGSAPTAPIDKTASSTSPTPAPASSQATLQTQPSANLANLPQPPPQRPAPDRKPRRSFRDFLPRPKSSSSSSKDVAAAGSPSPPPLDAGATPAAPAPAAGKAAPTRESSTDSNLSVPAAPQAAAPPRRRIRRLRRKDRTNTADSTQTQAPAQASSPPTSELAKAEAMLQRIGVQSAAELRLLRGKQGAKGAKKKKKQQQQQQQQQQRRAEKNKDGAAGPRRPKLRRTMTEDYSFKAEAGLDIIGIVMLEVKGARDLPRWKNMIGGFDMDPFTVISFGQKIYRTRVCRHTLNPVWDEKLLFHVRRYETNFQIKAAIYDWDRISSHDFCGGASLNVADLIAKAPKLDPATGLYDANLNLDQELATFELPLENVPEREVGGGNAGISTTEHLLNKLSLGLVGNKTPTLTLRAKFQPYAALRQRFWRELLKQFDTDDSGTLTYLEISSMLDSLGATLTRETMLAWFERLGKDADAGATLTLNEAIAALEGEVRKPDKEKRVVASSGGESGPPTPALHTAAMSSSGLDIIGAQAPQQPLPKLASKAIAVPEMSIEPPTPVDASGSGSGSAPFSRSDKETDPVLGGHARKIERGDSTVSASSVVTSGGATTGTTSSSGASSLMLGPTAALSGSGSSNGVRERVITLKTCPLCHMPRLSKKADADVITHLAVCASQDWRRVDSLMVSNFVTASQAHRKWFTKVVNRFTQGTYQLGANSANILAIDRRTGEICEERMPTYVRLGIRLLYQGAGGRMEGARIRRMLAAMSVKQGLKYNAPASKADIPGFVAFHNLNLDEVRDPLDSFATFNEFFYRRLKEGARPLDAPGDPSVLVSAADCRLMVFESVRAATEIWVKGRDFTIARLLGDQFADVADRYAEGAGFAIFRLAPQDYHRFHCPADATVGRIQKIEGQYYTVNPMAIRSHIDVYAENVREVVEFHSPQFGTFFVVCIGAMMVGSIGLEPGLKTGAQVKRGDPFGWFAFGGSTLCLVLPPGVCAFDEDLLENSGRALETLVRVGMRLGRATGGQGGGGGGEEGPADSAGQDGPAIEAGTSKAA